MIVLNKKLDYKPHIDGIRAIAVAFVILFHLNSDFFSFGYVGVDIFFIISGYVISQSLYKNHIKNKKINFIKFYSKRLKRLYPSLIFVVSTTLILYSLLTLLNNFNFYIKSGLTAIFGLSNIFFLRNGNDYFLESSINPFLHTWSLGIEEQFYLIYPLILFCLLKFIYKKRFSSIYIGNLILFMSLISFIIFFSNLTIIGNFFSPFSRFWELGIGCSLFFYSLKKNKIFNKSISIYSIIFLFFLLIFLNKSLHYYKIEIIIACCFSILLICLNKKNIFYNFLINKRLVFLGKLSYTMYLWHLPIIFFTTIYFNGIYIYIVSITFIYIFSYLTYKFIELPLRYNQSVDSLIKFSLKFSPIILIFLIIIINNIGLKKTKIVINNNINLLESAAVEKNYLNKNFNNIIKNSQHYSKYIFNNNKLTTCHQKTTSIDHYKKYCYKKNDNKNIFYLIGDSHSIHYVPMLDNSKIIKNLYVSTISDGFYVPNLFSTTNKEITNRDYAKILNEKKHLKNNIDFVRKESKNYNNNYVIISSKYSRYLSRNIFNDKMNKINKSNVYDDLAIDLENLINLIEKDTNIIFIENIFQPNVTLEECVGNIFFKSKNFEKKSDCDHNFSNNRKKIDSINNVLLNLENKYKNVKIFKSTEYLCPIKKCNFFFKKNQAMINDRSHLTTKTSSDMSNYFDKFLQSNY